MPASPSAANPALGVTVGAIVLAVLIACPECERKVSDRAKACPDCGFPVAEHVAETKAKQDAIAERETRVVDGETDCVACEARGFRTFEFADDDGGTRDGFSWCEICEHTGRVARVKSEAGFWAVRRSRLDAFVAGQLDAHETDAVSLGQQPPDPRYPASS